MKIPDKCYALNNMTIHPKTKVGNVIEIRAFETGYYKTTKTATQQLVDNLNKELGVTIAQAQAMESASMFGWNCYKSCLESYEKKFDSESDEPNGQDPDGTIDLGLEPLEEEWNDETDWCDYCQMDVKGDESGCCPHCGYLVTDLIEETDYLEEDDE